VAFPGSVNVFDLLVVFIVMAFFIAGYIQGAFRRLLGIASILFFFLVATQARDPFGGLLASEWSQFPSGYSIMLGFGIVFVIGSLVSTLAIQLFYDKVVLSERYEVVDAVLGGLLGILQALILLAAMIVILDSYFRVDTLGPFSSELPLLRNIFEAYDLSATAAILRGTLIPVIFAIFGPLVPDAVKGVSARI
jgi:uncharacterized membrane protein required for colicin V production